MVESPEISYFIIFLAFQPSNIGMFTIVLYWWKTDFAGPSVAMDRFGLEATIIDSCHQAGPGFGLAGDFERLDGLNEWGKRMENDVFLWLMMEISWFNDLIDYELEDDGYLIKILAVPWWSGAQWWNEKFMEISLEYPHTMIRICPKIGHPKASPKWIQMVL